MSISDINRLMYPANTSICPSSALINNLPYSADMTLVDRSLLKPKFHLARHVAARHDTLSSPRMLAHEIVDVLFCAYWAARRVTHVTASATRATRARSDACSISTSAALTHWQQTAVQTFCSFWLMHYVTIITCLLSPKYVITEVQSERNLNQIGNLRTKMTIIGNGHVAR